MIDELGAIYLVLEIGLASIIFSVMKKADQTLAQAKYGFWMCIIFMAIALPLLSRCSVEETLGGLSSLYGGNIDVCFPKTQSSPHGSPRIAITLITALILSELCIIIYLRLKKVLTK